MSIEARTLNRLLLFATVVLTGAMIATVSTAAKRLAETQHQLTDAQSELQQLRSAARPAAPAGNVDALRQLLEDRENALQQLRREYAALQQQTPRPAPTTMAAVTPPAAVATNSTQTAWLERLRTEDPERYKQIQEQREQRRRAAEELFEKQLTRLDERYQAAQSRDEADLVEQIADTLTRLDDLRQQWPTIRALPEEQRREEAQRLGAETWQTVQQLNELRGRDRQLQLQQLATQVGYKDERAISQFVESTEKIFQETDTNPLRFMGGGGGRGGMGGGPPAQ